jgi:hypothetical protein
MHPESWFFLVILVAVVLSFVTKMVRMKTELHGRENNNRAQWDNLLARLDRLEQRMSNIETIVVDTDKRRSYSQL